MSTHSPNVASVTPQDAVVLVKSDGAESYLVSLVGSNVFTAQQRADLERSPKSGISKRGVVIDDTRLPERVERQFDQFVKAGVLRAIRA